MEYLYLIGAAAVVAWAFRIEANKRREAKTAKEQFLDRVNGLPNYKPSAVHTYDYLYFAVDTENGAICYATSPAWKPLLVAACDILSVSVYEDGQTVTHTSRTSQAGGAIVGNILGGSTGAIIGGVGAQSTSTEIVSKIILRVEADVAENPIIDIPFLISRSRRSDPYYLEASRSARSYSSLVAALIKRGDSAEPSAPLSKDAVLESLKTLAGLRADGILNEDEFLREKSRILGHDRSA